MVVLLAASEDDVAFLRDCVLVEAAFPSGTRPPTDALADDHIVRYIEGWGRPGDLGLVAWSGHDPVGAAWIRLLAPDRPGYGFVDATTPELTVAVVEQHRGRGLGRALVAGILDLAATHGQPQVSLSVADAINPVAVGLYRSLGFAEVGRDEGGSLTMIAATVPAAPGPGSDSRAPGGHPGPRLGPVVDSIGTPAIDPGPLSVAGAPVLQSRPDVDPHRTGPVDTHPDPISDRPGAGPGPPVARAATVADGPALVRLREVMFVGDGMEGRLGWVAPFLSAWADGLVSGTWQATVVDDARGRPVASALSVRGAAPPAPGRERGRTAHIGSVATEPGWRRRGCARAVVTSLVEVLDADGVESTTLNATPDGVPLYASLGFTPSPAGAMRRPRPAGS